MRLSLGNRKFKAVVLFFGHFKDTRYEDTSTFTDSHYNLETSKGEL